MSATSSKNMTRTWLTNLEENSLNLKSEKCTFKKNKWLMGILLYELGIGPREEKVRAAVVASSPTSPSEVRTSWDWLSSASDLI